MATHSIETRQRLEKKRNVCSSNTYESIDIHLDLSGSCHDLDLGQICKGQKSNDMGPMFAMQCFATVQRNISLCGPGAEVEGRGVNAFT